MSIMEQIKKESVVIIPCLKQHYYITGSTLSQSSRGTEMKQGMLSDFSRIIFSETYL